MLSHTPGPWKFVAGDWNHGTSEDNHAHSRGSIVACGDMASFIAKIDNAPEEIANARLIAAAPELLKALEGLLALCEKQFGLLQKTTESGLTRMLPEGVRFEDLKFVKLSRAAIAKAKGEAC